jgi:tetratricopeptide (TPR) repeat protein
MAQSPPAAQRAQPWLFGPLPDLLVGCGLLYALALPPFFAWGGELRARQPDPLMPLLVLLVSLPHYGATLLRVYERPEDRRLYRRHAVYSSLAVFAAFVLALHVPLAAMALTTLYLTWSPWHYTAQNFGLASMFLRRRAGAVAPALGRSLRLSFVLSYALAFLWMHTGEGTPADYAIPLAQDSARFVGLGIPHAVSLPLGAVLLVGYLAALGATLVLLLRAATLRAALPTLALLLTQVLWFSLPVSAPLLGVASGLDPLDWSQRDFYFRWIAFGHASQYLWVTAYYARRGGGWTGFGSYLGKAALAATAVWVFPVVIFAPDALGTFSFDAGLAMLVGSAANVHHFILDGVIWKLRSRPVASVLIDAAQPAEPIAPPRRSPWRRAAWSVLAVGLAIRVFWSWELLFAHPAAMAREDFDSAIRVWNRLAWFGYDDSARRLDIGWALYRRDPQRALEQFERSVALHESATGWGSIAHVHANRGDWRAALAAYESGLAVAPDDPDLLAGAGLAALQAARPAYAYELLERANRIRPRDPTIERRLARAEREGREGRKAPVIY